MNVSLSLNRQQDRIYYLDYLRGFMVLLVVLDHAMHGYTRYFADYWFIQDYERSELLDIFHLHNDAIMMPFMFFLAGLFIFSSFERRGLVSYLTERFWRLVVPLVMGVILIAPFMSYDKGLVKGTIVEGYWTFWQSIILNFDTYPLDRATSSGFWFLTYLIILTLCVLVLYSVLPSLRRRFKTYACWIFARPVWGVGSLILILCLLNTVSDLIWGGPFWFVLKPFFGLRKARFLAKAFFFLMGIAAADAGLMQTPQILKRLKNSWKTWACVAGGLFCVYAWFVLTYINDGVFNMPIPYYVHQFRFFPDFDVMVRMIEDEALLPILRTILLGMVMVTLSLFYLSFFAKFLNTDRPGWKSLSVSSFGIYIFHEPFVTLVNRLLLDNPLPAEVKFFLAALTSLVISWSLVQLVLLRVPLLKRIL